MKMLTQMVSALGLLRGWSRWLVQHVMANVHVTGWSARERQRGATALEYIVLAAAIIIIVGVLATVFGDDDNPLVDAMRNLFSSAEDPG